MKILFLSLSGVRFDVSTPELEPLGGTESCVAYLATELARSNDVSLLANTDATVVRAVRHLSLKRTTVDFFQTHQFDVIILVNTPRRALDLRKLSPRSKLVLWIHDAPDRPPVQLLAEQAVAQTLDCVVYVSDWQRAQIEARFGVPTRAAVIGNGLTPSFENMFNDRQELLNAKELRAAYTSTPFRGLAILLDAHSRLAAPIDLDVFSSMRVYQHDDAPFRDLYGKARLNPRVHYHGSVSQIELAAAMRRVSFLSYPCVFPETFCIAALEAMAAGATVVSTDCGALASTTRTFGELLPLKGQSPNLLSISYAAFLESIIARTMKARELWAERMLEQIRVVNHECSWRRRGADWRALLAELMQSPTKRCD